MNAAIRDTSFGLYIFNLKMNINIFVLLQTHSPKSRNSVAQTWYRESRTPNPLIAHLYNLISILRSQFFIFSKA